MRTSRLILTIGILLVCCVFLTGFEMDYSAAEIIQGTWANTDYDRIESKYAKIKLTNDNTWVTYSTTSSEDPMNIGRYRVEDVWDGVGGVYYKVVRTADDELIKTGRSKLIAEDLNMVIANDVCKNKFGSDENDVFIIYKNEVSHVQRNTKSMVAEKIWDEIEGSILKNIKNAK